MAPDGADTPQNRAPDADGAPHLQDLITARFSRRALVGGLAALPLLSLADAQAAPGRLPRPRLPRFAAVAESQADTVTVPMGYRVQTLIGFGDALFELDAATPTKLDLTRAEQERRFGQNNDMLALFPVQWRYPASTRAKRFYLCANHEYFNPALMLPNVKTGRDFTADHMEAMYATMGLSVVQVEQTDRQWRVIRDPAPSARAKNRRITPFSPMVFDGPAARHPWVTQAAQGFNAANPAQDGEIACGTLANCAGGLTPWGTYLSAEENFDFYFYNSEADADVLRARASADPGLAADAASFGYALMRPTPTLRGAQVPIALPQYDLNPNPTAATLYGWTVELDPHDPTWTPRKRTALGRRKGECASTALTRDRRVAVYSGDDQANEFVYKFVSKGRFDPANRTANRELLGDGDLYVARLEADGSGRWIQLTLADANAAATAAAKPLFRDEGEVMIRARDAARLLGATPMDRPEDIEALHGPDWVGVGPVLVACTNNRNPKEASPGNPRRGAGAEGNLTGHIVRIDEADGDVGAERFRWDIFALGGDPNAAETVTPSGAKAATSVAIGGAPTFSGDRFACPDNLVIDSAFNVWISTDGNDGVFACNDAVLVTSAAATGARAVKRFLVGPVGAEICGPLLSPDERAFLCAIQHPGENDLTGRGIAALRFVDGKAPPSSFPDGPGTFPRSAVVVVTRRDGGKVNA
jgi:secreted PhoX family phosphatase